MITCDGVCKYIAFYFNNCVADIQVI